MTHLAYAGRDGVTIACSGLALPWDEALARDDVSGLLVPCVTNRRAVVDCPECLEEAATRPGAES